MSENFYNGQSANVTHTHTHTHTRTLCSNNYFVFFNTFSVFEKLVVTQTRNSLPSV